MEVIKSNQPLSDMMLQKGKKLEKENERLKGQLEMLMIELAEWKEKAHMYAKENELMNSTNRSLKAMMEEQNRKAVIYASALKEAL